jgi:hypothetical protein
MVATACIVLIGAYLFGFGTFRLRPVMVSLLALAIVAIVSGSGLVKLVGAGALTEGYKSDGGPVQTLADTAAAVICFVVLALSLLLLMAQGVFALLLWRHRLARSTTHASGDAILRDQSGVSANPHPSGEPVGHFDSSRGSCGSWRVAVVVFGLGRLHACFFTHLSALAAGMAVVSTPC